MEQDNIPDITHCVGCGLQCQLGSENEFEYVLCENKKIVVWPEDNYFLTASLNNLIFNKIECTFPKGAIIIDFCTENILLFLNDTWIKKLSAYGMNIVLISDQAMKSMARYWFNRKEEITDFLVVGEGMEKFIHNAGRIFNGRKISHRGIAEITEKEMQVLRMLSKGHSIRDISTAMRCSTKSIYNFQHSLCKKLGGLTRLDHLRLKHRVMW